MKLVFEILLIFISYLSGSIPFGYIFTKKFVGIDIRNYGSGNTGSTNVKRIAGKKVGIITQICDMMKGFIPVSFILLLQYSEMCTFDEFFIYAVGLASILGHNFSIFLRFNGGKGVNTTLGASLLLSPYSVFVSVVVYFMVKWSTKYVSLGSVCLAVSLTLTELIIHKLSYLFYYLLTCSLLILIRHIPNIKRIIHRTENKSE